MKSKNNIAKITVKLNRFRCVLFINKTKIRMVVINNARYLSNFDLKNYLFAAINDLL